MRYEEEEDRRRVAAIDQSRARLEATRFVDAGAAVVAAALYVGAILERGVEVAKRELEVRRGEWS